MPLKVPASLVRHLNEKRCVIFVGAGLSAQAKLPSWGQLLSNLVNQVGADDTDEDATAELKKLLDAGRYLDVADECKERLGSGYADFLSKALQVGTGPVPEAHQLVMQLPFAAWITTNYDKLLEQAHFQVRGSVPKTLTHLDADTFGTLLFDGAPFILKAHGDVDKPESLIFTTRDYREIIHSNPAFQAVFSAILLTRAVLFVGYSLNDPDFRLLLDRQLTMFKKFVPERYAIMAGVGDVEREVLRRTAQIKVIPYPAGQHDQLVEFLRMLQTQVAATPAPPLNKREEAGGTPVERAPPPAARAGGMSLEAMRNHLSTYASPKVALDEAAVEEKPPTHVEGDRAPLPDDLLDAGGLGPPARGGRLGHALSSPPPPAAAPAPPRATVQPAPPQSAPLPPKSERDERRLASEERGGRVRSAPSGTAAAAREPEGEEISGEQTAAHGSVSFGSASAGAAAAATQRAESITLSISANAHRTSAQVFNAAGEMVASGPGMPATGRALANLLGQARSVQEYGDIGESLAARIHSSVLETLKRMLKPGMSIELALDNELEPMPWELLEVGGQPLALQAAVSRAPVGLSSEARGWPMYHKPVRALLVGDPTEELPGARQEIEHLSKLYPNATVLMGRDATLERVTGMIGPMDFEVVHFAGHAWYDAQDVYLVLANGARLTDDLIRAGLSHHPPCVLFLNSHYTAFVPPGVSAKGAELMKATAAGRMGFTEVAMRAGVGAFIGCFGSPTDTGAEAVAIAFHRALLSGVPTAQALQLARTQPKLPPDDATPLLYSLSGYGYLTFD